MEPLRDCSSVVDPKQKLRIRTRPEVSFGSGIDFFFKYRFQSLDDVWNMVYVENAPSIQLPVHYVVGFHHCRIRYSVLVEMQIRASA
jgi:hypothetical protein